MLAHAVAAIKGLTKHRVISTILSTSWRHNILQAIDVHHALKRYNAADNAGCAVPHYSPGTVAVSTAPSPLYNVQLNVHWLIQLYTLCAINPLEQRFRYQTRSITWSSVIFCQLPYFILGDACSALLPRKKWYSREMGLARIYPHTKFEVSSFTRFRFTEGGLKFNYYWSQDPDHALLGIFCHAWDGTCQGLSVYRIWNEVSSFTRSRFTEGGLNLKILPRTTPCLGSFCHPWDGTCQDLRMYQIWSF